MHPELLSAQARLLHIIRMMRWLPGCAESRNTERAFDGGFGLWRAPIVFDFYVGTMSTTSLIRCVGAGALV